MCAGGGRERGRWGHGEPSHRTWENGRCTPLPSPRLTVPSTLLANSRCGNSPMRPSHRLTFVKLWPAKECASFDTSLPPFSFPLPLDVLGFCYPGNLGSDSVRTSANHRTISSLAEINFMLKLKVITKGKLEWFLPCARQ